MHRRSLLRGLLGAPALVGAPSRAGRATPRSGWPAVLDLDVGETRTVVVGSGRRRLERTIELRGIETTYFPDRWIRGNTSRRTVAQVAVHVSVSGEPATLWMRPYESPREVQGLRIYAEAERQWARAAEHAALTDLERSVRLAVTSPSEPWAPPALRFPVRDYRWRSASYNNTWSSLVPYNRLYYHRGEDFGAIPDRLPVAAMADGILRAVPGPAGDGGSNAIVYEIAGGVTVRVSHMNTGSIDPRLRPGLRVRAGQVLAKTGATYGGRPSQHMDPHLHVNLAQGGRPLASFPILVQAYFRSYRDPLLAIAGGYYFAEPGDVVELDGSRSLARPGRRIASLRWRLHDGRVVEGARARLEVTRPGHFAEELVVQADDGSEDRDFAHVRVWDPALSRGPDFGWLYHGPVRGIRPGTPVQFWIRRTGQAPVTVDFGDGTPAREVGSEATHSYQSPGLYSVSATAPAALGGPLNMKMRVVVEP